MDRLGSLVVIAPAHRAGYPGSNPGTGKNFSFKLLYIFTYYFFFSMLFFFKIILLVVYSVHLNPIFYNLIHRYKCPQPITLSILKSPNWSIKFDTRICEESTWTIIFSWFFFPLHVENPLPSLSKVFMNLFEIPIASLVTAVLLMFN